MQNDEQDAQMVSRHLKSGLLHCNMLDLFKRACFPKLEHEKKRMRNVSLIRFMMNLHWHNNDELSYIEYILMDFST